MRIFVFEYFSGGGLLGRPLPPSLAREGDLMAGALVAELAATAEVEVVASRDPRLPDLPGCEMLRPLPGESVAALFARGLQRADAAWPTAPESDGVLERLAATTLAAGRRLLGCRPEAVRVAGSKLTTARALAARGVPVVPTFSLADPPADVPGPWAVKPDDGAGCDGLELVPDRAAALARLATGGGRLVAQPWIAGEALSLSLLCGRGAPVLLACNRQRLGRHDGHITLDAILVNDVADTGGELARLARGVADAIPGLWGYVGVDLVQGAEGPLVLEVNPRLTTSYCGLRAARGCNTAALVVELARRGDLPITRLDRGVTAEVRVTHAA